MRRVVRLLLVPVGGLALAVLALRLLDVSAVALLPRTVTGWLVVGGLVAAVVLWSRLAVPRLTRRPWARTVLRVVPVLVLLAVAVVPAAVDRRVDEALLEGVPAPEARPAPPAGEPGGEPGGRPTGRVEEAAPVRLSSGAVRGVGHVAEGRASVYRSGGTDFVRLELDDVQGAVDVFVWLVPGADQTTPDGGVDLGALKGTRGNANYVVPAGVDVAAYRTVLLWCRAFSTPIAVAPQA